jgi:hypothetical protein
VPFLSSEAFFAFFLGFKSIGSTSPDGLISRISPYLPPNFETSTYLTLLAFTPLFLYNLPP